MWSADLHTVVKLVADGMPTYVIKNCMVFLVCLQAVRSEVSETSTYSLRTHASLPPEPVNRAVLHLRGFCDFTSDVLIVSFIRIK